MNNNISLALLVFTALVIAAGICITRRINTPKSHYEYALKELFATGKSAACYNVYKTAEWGQARNISFDNLPKQIALPENARELFNAAVSLLDLAMQADFDKQMSKHRQHDGGF